MHSDAYAAHSGGGKMPSGSGYSAIHTHVVDIVVVARVPQVARVIG